jgi:type II secretory pathway component PulC
MKRTVFYMIIIFLALAVVAPLVSDEIARYEAKGHRDPFVPLVGAGKDRPSDLSEITSVEEIELEGIAIGRHGRRIAIINGKMVKEGDKIGSVLIEKIDKRRVAVSIEGNVYNVTLKEEGGPKSEK